LIACAAVVLGLTVPAAADAKVPARFFGIGGLEYYGTSEFDRMRINGVAGFRAHLCWACVEQQRGVRDWSSFDHLVESASRAGITILPLVIGVPPWISQKGLHPPIHNKFERRSWARFLAAAADRYGSDGTFWTLNPLVPKRPLVHWEIWNEVNLRVYWGSKPNPKRYASLLGVSHKALVGADPKARIVHASLFPLRNDDFGIGVKPFVRGLYRVRGVKRRFDAMGLHPFGTKPAIVVKSTRALRGAMDRAGDPRAPIWITEFGWTTGGANWRQSPFRATPAQQARKLRKSYRRLIRERKRLRLKRVFWLTWRDRDEPGADYWTERMGVVFAGGKGKPALGAYARVVRNATR
jgi:hypothetical protein